MRRHLVAGIDIGTSVIRLVAMAERAGKHEIVATAQGESKGLRHGYIINLDEAAEAISAVVQSAEKKTGQAIRRAFISVAGISLTSVTGDASIAISKSDGEVTQSDVERLLALAEANAKYPANHRIVHSVPLQYKIDTQKVLGNPVGMRGSVFEVHSIFITVLDQHLESLVKAVEAANVQVEDVVASPIAASLVTLSKVQRTAGCVLANIGAETVSIAVFEEKQPFSVRVFPLGSTDITNDIALGLKISIEEAEELKLHRERVASTRKKLDEIIVARLSDIFDLIAAHLKKIGRDGLLPAGIVLTGGGSSLDMIEQLARSNLRLPAKIARLAHPGNLTQIEESDKKTITVKDSSWAVAYGLCILGLTTESDDFMQVRVLKEAKKSMIHWIQRFLP